MLIILEGTDLAGKTTLARQLTEAALNLGHTVDRVNAGPPAPGLDPLDEYELYLTGVHRAAALNPHHLLILDRWHLGELVYGPLLRGVSRLTPVQFRHVECFLEALGAVRVVVDCPDSRLQTRYADRGDTLVTLDQVISARDMYEAYATWYHWRVVCSPVSRRTVLDLLVWADVECLRAQQTRDFPGYVGPSWPRLLLVGDEPNRHLTGSVPRPAFMPYHGNSGYYLLTALNAVGVTEGYGLINSTDGTDVLALYEALNRPRVVGLGRRAQAQLTYHEVPHVPMPHPQWVKRFRHHDLLAYGRQLVHLEAGETT